MGWLLGLELLKHPRQRTAWILGVRNTMFGSLLAGDRVRHGA